MIGQGINAFLAGIGALELTDYAIFAMGGVLVLAVIASLFGRLSRLSAQTATILTSIGILGTFAGIVVGLYGFDASPDAIDGSIQTLLSGLTTAFTSSLVGMALAVLWKLWSATVASVRGDKLGQSGGSDGTPISELVALSRRQGDELEALREAIVGSRHEPLGDLVSNVERTLEARLAELCSGSTLAQRLLKEQRDALERLQLSLVDDDDASLAGQLRGLRTELADRERTRRAERDAAKRSVETGNQSLEAILAEVRDASAGRARVVEATVAAERASRTGAEVVSSALPEMAGLCRNLAEELARGTRNQAEATRRAEALVETGNRTLERVAHAVGESETEGVFGEVNALKVELRRDLERTEVRLAEVVAGGERRDDVLTRILSAAERQGVDLMSIRTSLGEAAYEGLLVGLGETKQSVETAADRLDGSIGAMREEAGRRGELQAETGRTVVDRLAGIERLEAGIGDSQGGGVVGGLRELRALVDASNAGAERRAETQRGMLDAAREQIEGLGRLGTALGDPEGGGVTGGLRDLRALAGAANEGAVRREEGQQALLSACREQAESLNRLGASLGDAETGGVVGELRELRALTREAANDQIAGLGTLGAAAEARRELLSGALNTAREQLALDGRRADDVQERFREIVGLLSRSPTEEIIEALKATIREFNEHIAEQFGDNFKQLNEAVGSLLQWQDNYRVQLEQMDAQYNASVQAIGATERSVASIAERGEAIPAQMERLSAIVEANDVELGRLRDHLAAFAEARDRAVTAVPEIARIVGETVTGLADAGQSLTRGVENGATSMTEAIQKSVEGYVRATDSVNENVLAIAQRSHDETARLFSGLKETIETTYQESKENLKALTEQEFEDMTAVRRTEIDNLMRAMGSQLASITKRFTEDYAELVEAMDRVIRTVPQGRDAA